MLSRIQKDVITNILNKGVELGAYPGATLHVIQDGKTLIDLAIGTLDGTRRVTPSTLYDLASITKPIATAAVITELIRMGELSLTQTVGELLGSDGGRMKDVPLGHLLMHTSGLPAHIPCYAEGLGLDAAVDAIIRTDTDPVGTMYRYSCLGYILLAKVIHCVTHLPVDVIAKECVWDPLALHSLTFRPGNTTAPTKSTETPSGQSVTLIGIPHDGNARGIMAAQDGFVSGNAGCFGTARDVAAFGSALLSACWLGKSYTDRWIHPQSTPVGHTFGLFSGDNPLVPKGDIFGQQACGHSGYTGTVLLLDPPTSSVIGLCTNAVYSHKETFLLHRRRILNVIAGIL